MLREENDTENAASKTHTSNDAEHDFISIDHLHHIMQVEWMKTTKQWNFDVSVWGCNVFNVWH